MRPAQPKKQQVRTALSYPYSPSSALCWRRGSVRSLRRPGRLDAVPTGLSSVSGICVTGYDVVSACDFIGGSYVVGGCAVVVGSKDNSRNYRAHLLEGNGSLAD